MRCESNRESEMKSMKSRCQNKEEKRKGRSSPIDDMGVKPGLTDRSGRQNVTMHCDARKPPRSTNIKEKESAYAAVQRWVPHHASERIQRKVDLARVRAKVRARDQITNRSPPGKTWR